MSEGVQSELTPRAVEHGEALEHCIPLDSFVLLLQIQPFSHHDGEILYPLRVIPPQLGQTGPNKYKAYVEKLVLIEKGLKVVLEMALVT
jgi:hypothetical protein